MTRRRKSDPDSRTVVRQPEQSLEERVLDLAAPLIERLGAHPALDDVQRAVELAVTFWNASVDASGFWGDRDPRQLNALKRKMTGRKAAPGDAELFELLSGRWRDRKLDCDPRLVGTWSLEPGSDGEPRLSCDVELPDGVELEIPPPLEKRVGIGGRFLDEVRIPLTATSLLSFPVQQHRGTLDSDGTATVHTKMPTAVALFAEGVLPPKGGAAVELVVQGRKLGAMVLTAVRCDAHGGYNDVAVLVFKPAAGVAS